MPRNHWHSFAAFSGFLAIVSGAIGAHAVADPHLASLVEKASFYQLIHALLLLWLSTQNGQWLKLSRWLTAAGIILFCGSLTLKGTGILPAATLVAPLGGVSLMAAWLCILVAGSRR